MSKINLCTVLFLLSTLAGLTACNKKSDEPAPKHEFALPFNQPASVKLTEQQRDEFLAMKKMKSTTDVTTPLLKPVKESVEDLQARLKKRRDASAGLRSWIDSVEMNCLIRHPSEQNTDNGRRGIGSRLTTITLASVDGDRCPLTLEERNTRILDITSYDQAANLMHVKVTLSRSQTARSSASAPNAGEIQIIESITNSEASGDFGARDDKMVSGELQGRITGSFRTLAGESGDIRAHLRLVQRQVSGATESELIIHMQVAFHGVDYVVSQRMLSVDEKMNLKETYLNGELSPELQLAFDLE